MNCEDFLPDLETGGPWRRMRARRHAARCPRCAAVYSAFRAAKSRLATPDLLSPRVRELWIRAAEGVVLRPEHRRRWVPAVACLATVACFFIAFVGPALWVKPPTIVSPVTVVQLDPADDFSQLADAASQLDAQLKSLRTTAQRLEARREVMIALNQYEKW
ncbi:MAG: hypothetical protein ACM3U2_18340 [Deltaproteobacteria bacterium]